MSSLNNLTFRLAPEDREEIASAVSTKLLGGLSGLLAARADVVDSGTRQGIRVVSPSDLAKQLGKTVRHLYRLESTRKMPQRRRISRRLTGYLLHEVEGVKATEAIVIDRRSLTREQVAAKLGVKERTVVRLQEDSAMNFPLAIDGFWLELDLDLWLLERPKVEPAR